MSHSKSHSVLPKIVLKIFIFLEWNSIFSYFGISKPAHTWLFWCFNFIILKCEFESGILNWIIENRLSKGYLKKKISKNFKTKNVTTTERSSIWLLSSLHCIILYYICFILMMPCFRASELCANTYNLLIFIFFFISMMPCVRASELCANTNTNTNTTEKKWGGKWQIP